MTDRSLTDELKPADSENTTPENADSYLTRYVGAERKFKEPEELAKGYANADLRINELNTQVKELEEKLAAYGDIDKFLAEDDPKPTPANVAPVPNKDQQPPKTTDVDINAIVESKLQAAEARKNAEINFAKSTNMLKEAFGDKAQAALLQYVDGSKEVEKFVNTLAHTDPERLVRLVKQSYSEPGQKKSPTMIAPGADRHNMQQTVFDKGLTWSAAQELRRKDPKEYAKLRPQILKKVDEYASRGEDFYKT